MQDKFYGMLGISAKAGAVASGAFAAEQAIKEGKAFLLIIAGDASDNAKKDYEGKARGWDIPFVIYGDKELLGQAIGKDERAIIAITDEKLAKALLSKISGR